MHDGMSKWLTSTRFGIRGSWFFVWYLYSFLEMVFVAKTSCALQDL